MQGKVEICGINTAKLEVLKNDEMTVLLRRTKEGDMAAREKLIRGNLRLVLSVLQRFASRGENMDDLFQVGCIGLIKAVDNFDINQPVRFSTYGVPMIVGRSGGISGTTAPSGCPEACGTRRIRSSRPGSVCCARVSGSLLWSSWPRSWPSPGGGGAGHGRHRGPGVPVRAHTPRAATRYASWTRSATAAAPTRAGSNALP